MNVSPQYDESRPCWFVGAYYQTGGGDQTARFVEEGIWENGHLDRYLEEVKSIRPGDRIAIKAAYTRKRELRFDNRGRSVSVMAIKATGIVKENLGNGRHLEVDWTRVDPPREWYFFTDRHTVWRVQPGGRWGSDELIRFTFEGQQQDVDYFRNDPFWRGRYGDETNDDPRFEWTRFYEAIADKLLAYRANREPLVKAIHAMAERGLTMPNLQDRFEDGTTGPFTDICPFTTFGIFNRGITDQNRKANAQALAGFLGVDASVPDSFAGVSVLDNRKSRVFPRSKDRGSGDIDLLWDVFASAIHFAESGGDEDAHSSLIESYGNALRLPDVNWNLTMGLHWTRPWHFQNLDGRSRPYISEVLQIPLFKRNDSREYLELLDTLDERFQTEECPVHSFPELSLAAWNRAMGKPDHPPPKLPPTSSIDPKVEPPGRKTETPAVEPYSVDNIVEDGCFLERETIKEILERLRSKKNLILQGPPGTGKTWLAKRLAFALMNQRDESKVRSLQFHPNLSYEDFVRGLRPAGNGRLDLVDGPFIEMINDAKSDPSAKYVLVIEEINRGQPAQIFGEMLTLLEADKRNPDSSLELTYRQPGEIGVYIPDNLYLVGTMNIADRSLALVDFAFRRRFAFVNLEPVLDERWSGWVRKECAIDTEALSTIGDRLGALNSIISDDPNLGPQFRVGHSFVTPPPGSEIPNAHQWFRQVVRTEIGPLLEEYWFDNREQAASQLKRLLEGI